LADEALMKMIEDGAIIKDDEPTPWVAPMVVVPKPGQKQSENLHRLYRAKQAYFERIPSHGNSR